MKIKRAFTTDFGTEVVEIDTDTGIEHLVSGLGTQIMKSSGRFPWSNIPVTKLSADEKLETLWKQLGDIPVDDDGKIQEPFLFFPAETNREEIWKWFDKWYSKGAAALQNAWKEN